MSMKAINSVDTPTSVSCQNETSGLNLSYNRMLMKTFAPGTSGMVTLSSFIFYSTDKENPIWFYNFIPRFQVLILYVDMLRRKNLPFDQEVVDTITNSLSPLGRDIYGTDYRQSFELTDKNDQPMSDDNEFCPKYNQSVRFVGLTKADTGCPAALTYLKAVYQGDVTGYFNICGCTMDGDLLERNACHVTLGKCQMRTFDPGYLRNTIIQMMKKSNMFNNIHLNEDDFEFMLEQNYHAIKFSTYYPCFMLTSEYDRHFAIYLSDEVMDGKHIDEGMTLVTYAKALRGLIPNKKCYLSYHQMSFANRMFNQHAYITAQPLKKIIVEGKVNKLFNYLVPLLVKAEDEKDQNDKAYMFKFDIKRLLIAADFVCRQALSTDINWSLIACALNGYKCMHCIGNGGAGIFTKPYAEQRVTNSSGDWIHNYILFLNVRDAESGVFARKAMIRFIIYDTMQHNSAELTYTQEVSTIFDTYFRQKIEQDGMIIKRYYVIQHGRFRADTTNSDGILEHTHAQIIPDEWDIVEKSTLSYLPKWNNKVQPCNEVVNDMTLSPTESELLFEYCDAIRRVCLAIKHGSYHSKTLFRAINFSSVDLCDATNDTSTFFELMKGYICIMHHPDITSETYNYIRNLPFFDKRANQFHRNITGKFGIDDIFVRLREITKYILKFNPNLNATLDKFKKNNAEYFSSSKRPSLHLTPFVNSVFKDLYPKIVSTEFTCQSW